MPTAARGNGPPHVIGRATLLQFCRVASLLRRHSHARRLVLVSYDAACWVLSLTVAATFSQTFTWQDHATATLLMTGAVAVVAQALTGVFLGIYRGRYAIGTADEVSALTVSLLLSGIVTFASMYQFADGDLPRATPFLAMSMTIVLAFGARFAFRRMRELGSRPDASSSQPTIVIGADLEGQILIRAILADPDGAYHPIAILDDNPDLRRRRVSGIAVQGTTSELEKIARKSGAKVVIVAIRNAESGDMRSIAARASAAGLVVKVLPPVSESLRSWVTVSDLRELNIDDLLGRQPADIDLLAVADTIAGRRVLVTGAGGSIGSELCRQLHRFAPAELLMLDRDESALHAVQLSLYGRALLNTQDVILADIRDTDAIDAVFRARRPDVVFHAAALKHLPVLEQFPEEAWKTNVLGTVAVLQAAQAHGVEQFVNISTDKAADPISVLGYSKRIGEMLVADVARHASGKFVSVRFGNVLGSRGSVLSTFKEQLSNGGPVTITDPDVTRYFMTIPEAVQLVVYAAAIGGPGEALVLDMGAPIRIADVARQLMSISGQRAEIVYTGLRDGEKLHESLFGHDEVDVRPVHPSVSHVNVPALDTETMVQRASLLGVPAALIDLTHLEPVHIPSQTKRLTDARSVG